MRYRDHHNLFVAQRFRQEMCGPPAKWSGANRADERTVRVGQNTNHSVAWSPGSVRLRVRVHASQEILAIMF